MSGRHIENRSIIEDDLRNAEILKKQREEEEKRRKEEEERERILEQERAEYVYILSLNRLMKLLQTKTYGRRKKEGGGRIQEEKGGGGTID